MNLVVTGGAGYIGSVVAELAVQAGHTVTVIDNLNDGSRGAIPTPCDFVQGDVGDTRVLTRAFGLRRQDAVLHLAAEAAIGISMTEPDRFYQANVVQGLALLDAMRAHGVSRLVFASTAAVYGEPQGVPIDERHPKAPINAYGDSKLAFETILRWYHHAYGLKSISFRFFNAAGATAEHGEARRHETHLIPRILDVATGVRPMLTLYGDDYPTRDGSCVRDYVHVADIGRAHLLALDALDRIQLDAFNIGTETGATVFEVLRATEAVVGRRIPMTIEPRRPGDPAVLVASHQRIRSELKWEPQQPALEEIVRSAWAWRQSHPSGYAS
ncbi:MAG: UDP-glucose 4-epimerase GalE [Vicinamibacterales bacterium]